MQPKVAGVPGHPQMVLLSLFSRTFALWAWPRLFRVTVTATGIFLAFAFGGEGDAEEQQGRKAHPCYGSKARPLAFSTEDESLERETSWLKL